MKKHRRRDGVEILKLTKWELGNLHLPSVTTITLYEGAAPIEFLRRQLALMLAENPWVTARIVKKSTPDGVVALAYARSFDLEQAVDQHLRVYEPGEVGLSLALPYEDLVNCLKPVQCVRSKPATDEDEPLFKVAVVPVEGSPGFALVVSMNHTLGDGHTYYKLYGMLGADAPIEALDPVRIEAFEAAKSEVIGESDNAMFTSAALSLGIVGTYLWGKLTRREPQSVLIYSVDPEWVAKEKSRAKEEGQVPYISSNDALTSWFFSEMKADLNIMVANFRSREPSILGLTDRHVGNYEANVPYFPGDVENPALIRQSIRSADGGFRARRAGSPLTAIPGFSTLIRNRTTIITNWASFYRDLVLRDGEADTIAPSLHLPIMEPDGGIGDGSRHHAARFHQRRGGGDYRLVVGGSVDGLEICPSRACRRGWGIWAGAGGRVLSAGSDGDAGQPPRVVRGGARTARRRALGRPGAGSRDGRELRPGRGGRRPQRIGGGVLLPQRGRTRGAHPGAGQLRRLRGARHAQRVSFGGPHAADQRRHDQHRGPERVRRAVSGDDPRARHRRRAIRRVP